jgi:hypothetical protein
MPLPGPPGIARRLVFLRASSGSFTDEERAAAVLLQPHIADALRYRAHGAVARLLTAPSRSACCTGNPPT